MILHPEQTADGGCWISDDRVYAFVSATAHAVAEIGYHGPQPVSRNSRVFVGHPAVLALSGGTREGGILPIRFEEFDWFAGGLRIRGRCGALPIMLDLLAAGRSLVLRAEGAALESLQIQWPAGSCFRDVHGQRTWSSGTKAGAYWKTAFRDRILLDEWMKRTGPYAGDFLIPEPLRRKIFRRPVRSGEGRGEDLRSEYRGVPMPVYDAEVPVWIGGSGYRLRIEKEDFLFTARKTGHGGEFPPFAVHFEEPGEEQVLQRLTPARERYERAFREAPDLIFPGYRSFREFFASVPALVESCVVQDIGVPRATPGRYYWIWAWDAMVTSMASLRWGGTETARRTVAFIDAHRDQDGCVPMRWTHALEPLDSQGRSALESLLASLACMTASETGSDAFLAGTYPRWVDHLRAILSVSDSRGLYASIGFYPDLPLRFGRTESSAVALEVGCFYTFCRTMEVLAHRMADQPTAAIALEASARLEKTFPNAFWEGGFIADAVDITTGAVNRKHPLFSLLFLHSPLGWPLLRENLPRCAEFIAKTLLTDNGMRVLPPGESGSETISSAWYPHWDLYALRILRRAGRAEEILRWLAAAERLLTALGFCPEYLVLPQANDEPQTLSHGSPSNLNCVTAWYQGFIEGVIGLEPDPGGLTIIPLGLPIGDISLKGIRYQGTRWNVEVQNRGKELQSVRVDGAALRGSLKIPGRFSDGGDHTLQLRYGEAGEPALFREITNAEVLDVRAEESRVEVTIRALGRCDVIYSCPGSWALWLDGTPAPDVRRLPDGTWMANLSILGNHLLRLTRGGEVP